MDQQDLPISLIELTKAVPKKDFKDIATLAAAICQVPLAVVTLIDTDDSQLFRAGNIPLESDKSLEKFIRSVSSLGTNRFTEIKDLRKHDSLKTEPFVTNVTKNRQLVYFGSQPISFKQDSMLGTICVFGKSSAKLNKQQRDALSLLAGRVVQLVELQFSNHEVDRLNRQLKEASRLGRLGYWELNLETGELFWSDEVYAIWQKNPDNFKITLKAFMESIPEDDRQEMVSAQDEVLAGKKDLNIRHRIVLDDCSIKWVHERGKLKFNGKKKAIALSGSVQDITEEKLNELSIAQHADFIASTLDNLPVGISVNRISDGKATYMNPRFSEIYGWPEETLTDVEAFFKSVYKDPEYRADIKERVVADIVSGDPDRMEWKNIEITTSKGEKKVVDAKNIPLQNQDLMISTVTDVTVSHAFSKELKAMNERYKFVTRATSDTIWDRNLSEKALYWGENYKKNLGFNDQENPGNSYLLWFNRLHPEDRERVEKSYNRALEGTSDKWTCEYRYKHYKDDTYLYVHDRGFIIRDIEGNAIRMVGAMQDVTTKFLQEKQLKLFETVVASANDPILITEAEPVTGPDGPRITYVNAAFEKMTGYTARDLIGKTPRILQGLKTDPESIALIHRELKEYNSVEVDILNYKKNGEEFWVNLSIAPVKDSRGDYTNFISIQREITLVKAEKDNRDLLKQLAQDISECAYVEALLDKIVITVGEKIEKDAVELWMVNNDRSAIELASFYGRLKNSESLIKFKKEPKFRMGEGFPGSIWQKRHAIVAWDISRPDSGFIRNKIAGKLGINSAYGLPLLMAEQVIGILVVYSSSTSRSYKERMIRRLQGLDYYLGAEIQRKKVQQQLETVIQSVPDIICLVGPDGHIKQINESARGILGYETQELIGRNYSDFVYPEDLAPSDEKMNSIKSSKYLKYYENRLLHKNGEIVWMAWTANPADREGNHLGVGKDITEMKKALDQIQKSNERFKIATEATNDAIWEWDRATDSVIWMEGFKRLFDYEARTYSKQFCMAKVHPEDQSGIVAHMKAELENPDRKIVRVEYRFKRKDGTYAVVSDQAQILRDSNQVVKGMIGAMQDITERKKNEKELLHLNKSLKEKNEQLALSNTELEHFAYVASHDLQEPLRMIGGFLTQLNKKYGSELDEKARTYIHYAVDGAGRMRTIIQELLQYSRLGRQQQAREIVHIGEILEGVEALYRQLIRETGAVIRKPADLPTLISYRVLLFQVFQNLLDNALKYRKEGIPPVIEISFNETDTHWLFKVKDNGIGIDSQYFDKIFTIFQRLHGKGEYEGTGMGLTNAKKIVESLGGTISVDSAPGKGAEFSFSITKVEEKA